MKSLSWITHDFNVPGLLYLSLNIQGDAGKPSVKAFVREVSYKEVPEVWVTYWPALKHDNDIHQPHEEYFIGEGALKTAKLWCEEQFEKEIEKV
jgi:hypothetical protein